MIKNNGKYYLHYAAPGTEWKTYADGIYTADAPLGPFTYAEYSPFSFKPTGFISGAGHGCTFRDKAGNWWRIVTMTISVKHMFERRLGLVPVGFDADGHIRTNTEFADYPQYLPGVKADPVIDNFTGWMLLSRYKQARASSIIEDHGTLYAVDEDVRTYWSAATGDSGEWLAMDLGKACDIHAIQVNFAENGTNPRKVRGREVVLYQQYFIETSLDSLVWTLLVDKSANMKDVPHDYIELAQPAQARYVRIVNVFSPGEGKFALRDLRIFGNLDEAYRSIAANMNQVRNPANGRDATIVWDPVPGADGYVVRYGIHPFKLYNNYMVYDTNSVDVHSLNKDVTYVFEVESFDSGTEYYRGSYTGVGDRRGAGSPEGFGLGQNYPNPFNPQTRIPYELRGVQDVHLDVFSLNGRKVFTYSEDAKPAGSHEILLSVEGLPNGIYVYRLQAGESTQQRKMVVLK
jgi:hypothetical protein